MFNFPMTNIFPAIIIGLSFWSSLSYFVGRMPLHGWYWFFAGALNFVVLFMSEEI